VVLFIRSKRGSGEFLNAEGAKVSQRAQKGEKEKREKKEQRKKDLKRHEKKNKWK
jgi:hypothetical protein